jgi:hypothetical protein
MNELKESLLKDWQRIVAWNQRTNWTWEEVFIVVVAIAALTMGCILAYQAVNP